MGNTSSSASSKTTGPKPTEDGPKCHYQLLGVTQDVTALDLKRAYRQKALLLHPDKNPHRLEEAHHEFAAVQAAYEVLSDPQERAWYDRHRESILRQKTQRGGLADDDEAPGLDDLMEYFNVEVYSGFGDGPKGFFAVYRELFQYLEEFEEAEELFQHQVAGHSRYPSQGKRGEMWTSFGSQNTPYEPMVHKFYEKWLHFTSNRTFDEGDRYCPTFHDNRRLRRAMQKENDRERDRLRREFSETVRQLAAFVRKRDPRWLGHQRQKTETRQREEKERKGRERERRAEAAAAFVEQDWSRVEVDQLARAFNSVLGSLGGDPIGEDPEATSDTDPQEAEAEEYYCGPCKKVFKNPAQWRNHERSKKHRQALWAMGIDPDAIVEDLDEDVDGDVDGIVDGTVDGIVDGNVDEVEHGHMDRDELDVDLDVGRDVGLDTGLQTPAVQFPESTATPADRTDASSPRPRDLEDGATCSTLPRKAIKKSRRAQTKTKTADDNDLQDQRCNVCGETFGSRNQLFAHVTAMGHMLAPTKDKNSNNKGKKGKRKP